MLVNTVENPGTATNSLIPLKWGVPFFVHGDKVRLHAESLQWYPSHMWTEEFIITQVQAIGKEMPCNCVMRAIEGEHHEGGCTKHLRHFQWIEILCNQSVMKVYAGDFYLTGKAEIEEIDDILETLM